MDYMYMIVLSCSLLGNLTFVESALYAFLFPNNPENRGSSIVRVTRASETQEIRISNPIGNIFNDTSKTISGSLDSFVEFSLPPEIRTSSHTTKEHKVILLEAPEGSQVVAFSVEERSWGAFYVLPMGALGKRYYAVCYQGAPCAIQVAAPSDGSTTITFRFPRKPKLSVKIEGRTLNGGDIYLVALSQYQCFQMLTDDVDLTGTEVSADKLIAVFSGNPQAYIPPADGVFRPEHVAGDHVVEMLVPVQNWASYHLVVPTPNRDNNTGDLLRIMAARDHTNVTFVSSYRNYYFPDIGPSSWVDVDLLANEYTIIESDQAVQVIQFGRSLYKKTLHHGASMAIVTSPFRDAISPLIVSFPTSVSGTTFHFLRVKEGNGNGKLTFVDTRWRGEKVVYDRPLPYLETVYSALGYTAHQTNAYFYPLHIGFNEKTCPPPDGSTVADGFDNDCDGLVDEEQCGGLGRGKDEDGDGFIDEDCGALQEEVKGCSATCMTRTRWKKINSKIGNVAKYGTCTASHERLACERALDNRGKTAWKPFLSRQIRTGAIYRLIFQTKYRIFYIVIRQTYKGRIKRIALSYGTDSLETVNWPIRNSSIRVEAGGVETRSVSMRIDDLWRKRPYGYLNIRVFAQRSGYPDEGTGGCSHVKNDTCYKSNKSREELCGAEPETLNEECPTLNISKCKFNNVAVGKFVSCNTSAKPFRQKNSCTKIFDQSSKTAWMTSQRNPLASVRINLDSKAFIFRLTLLRTIRQKLLSAKVVFRDGDTEVGTETVVWSRGHHDVTADVPGYWCTRVDIEILSLSPPVRARLPYGLRNVRLFELDLNDCDWSS